MTMSFGALIALASAVWLLSCAASVLAVYWNIVAPAQRLLAAFISSCLALLIGYGGPTASDSSRLPAAPSNGSRPPSTAPPPWPYPLHDRPRLRWSSPGARAWRKPHHSPPPFP